MNTSELAKQIISKIWYYVENPENEQHSGKKLIDLISTSFKDKDVLEIQEIIETKNEEKLATLNNLIENKLLESGEFQKQAKYLAFLNDRRLGINNSDIGMQNEPSSSNVLLNFFIVICILGGIFTGGISTYLGIFLLLIRVVRMFSK